MQARLLVFVHLHRQPFGDGNQQRDIFDERMNVVLLILEDPARIAFGKAGNEAGHIRTSSQLMRGAMAVRC
jgi:hypothetical protein